MAAAAGLHNLLQFMEETWTPPVFRTEQLIGLVDPMLSYLGVYTLCPEFKMGGALPQTLPVEGQNPAPSGETLQDGPKETLRSEAFA